VVHTASARCIIAAFSACAVNVQIAGRASRYFQPVRGIFSTPFTLSLGSPFPGPVFIKYVINSVVNAVPTFASLTVGTNYTAPIVIDRTCLVTAMAFSVPSLVASNLSFHVCSSLRMIVLLLSCYRVHMQA
jgi:hypothetical protein